MNKIITCIFLVFFPIHSFAAERIVNFSVAYKTVNFDGKSRQAITVNGEIPAPILHFKQGDHVTINVTNHLKKETAIHWHGIILPWQMDGVLGVTQKGIKPGETFRYQFTLKQFGTYWYHAHAGLQEQQGLYGAFLVDPQIPPAYKYTKDYVMVLSDWSDTAPEQILENLKKEGDYYSPRFPLQPSLMKFIHDYKKADSTERKMLVDDYLMMQQMRMSIYDLSDVAYDSYLLNGRTKSTPWKEHVKVGDVVRLRFIGAAGSTVFHVKIPNAIMELVHVQGNDIKPYNINDFYIAPGETYDVLVKITKNEPYIIYAESIDTLGVAYGVLTTSPNQRVDFGRIKPFPEPLPVTRDMMAFMMGKMHEGELPSSVPVPIQDKHHMHHEIGHDMPHDMHHDTHHDMQMPTEPIIMGDNIVPSEDKYKSSKGTKYEHMVAGVKTNDPNKPVAGVINMELFGYMDRYIWFINGVPEYNAKPIILEPAKRYRIVFTNTSMMRHPMHIHGHWFILRKGNGSYDPLLHTIEVAPGATITADVDTDASGQWLFHCHMLYHMMTGMSRVFQYSTLISLVENQAKPEDIVKTTKYINRPIVRVDKVRPIDKKLVEHPMAHHVGLWRASYLEGGASPSMDFQQLTYKGLYGSDYNKLDLFINEAELRNNVAENANIDVFYWHLLNQFWAIKGGVNYVYRPAEKPYWQPGIGLEGVMPFFIDTNIRGYAYKNSWKLDLELSRDTQITNNFFIRTGIRSIVASKTVVEADIGAGLNQMYYILRPYYRMMPGLNVFVELEREQNFGVFRILEQNQGQSNIQDTLSLGISMLL